MPEFFRQHWTYLIGALALHVLFAGVFALTLISMQRNAPPPQLAIQATIVDRSQLERSAKQQKPTPPQEDQAKKEQQLKQEAERKQQEDQERRETQERAERQRQEELKQREEQEQRRQAEERQVREQAEKQKQADEERQRKAEAERKRVEEIERKQKEEAAKRKAADDARAQQAREADLRKQMEEEEGRDQAANSGLLNQYVAMIEQRIVRNWNKPPSARPGLECEVRVTQTPGGTVLSVQIGKCNGDPAVQESIRNAVDKSSPLPPPPDPRLFERTLVLIFKPAE